jgi:hypothetical protein
MPSVPSGPERLRKLEAGSWKLEAGRDEAHFSASCSITSPGAGGVLARRERDTRDTGL